MKSNLLGLIMEGEGFLTRPQVKKVLEEQDRLRASGQKYLPFGELALKMGLVDIERLKRALMLQRKLSVPNDDTRRIGAILLELRLVTPTALLAALEKQSVQKRRVGEILVDEGRLSRGTLVALLDLQATEGDRAHLSERVVVSALEQAAAGKPVAELCQELGLPRPGQAAQPAGTPNLPALVAGLQNENLQLKRLVGQLRHENQALKQAMQAEPAG